MAFADSVFYYWSDKEWDSCDRFREAATAVLNKQSAPDLLEWGASDTQVCFQRWKAPNASYQVLAGAVCTLLVLGNRGSRGVACL